MNVHAVAVERQRKWFSASRGIAIGAADLMPFSPSEASGSPEY
jgi:hypothetical protein